MRNGRAPRLHQGTVRRRRSDDGGFTLIETLVALLVFSIIATGVIASSTTILRMSADNRSREVATNLAGQATDAVRLIGDPFDVLSSTTSTTVDRQTFTVVRKAVWVSSAGGDRTCSGSADLLYKRITVTVTWGGRLPTTAPVRTDTLLSTRSGTTDASTGAVLVSVVDAAGAAVGGVVVTITPGSSGAALTDPPDDTDADGCSYATGVAPGVYTVAISRAASLDARQVAAPTATVSVAAGSTVSASFQYDAAGVYPITHAANAGTASAPLLPTDLQTTLIPVVGTDTVAPVITSAAATSASAWPTASGYVAIAGATTTAAGASRCSAFDPAAWPAGTSSGTALAAGTRPAPAAAAAGGTATVAEKMGVVTGRASGTGRLVATMAASSAAAGGNPGCTVSTTYAFGGVLTNGTVTVALPFGAWTLGSTDANGTRTTALTSATTVTNAVTTTSTASGGSVAVVLDPRARS